MNDGVIDDTNLDSTHLLCIGAASDGTPIQPVITLRFSQPVQIDTIVIHGGGAAGNVYPGAIETASIGIADTFANLTSTATGQPSAGGLRDDTFDLTATGLSLIPTTEVKITELVGSYFTFPVLQAAIAEITVAGRPAPATAEKVQIDIRPLVKKNVVILNSRLPLPFAVLSSATFDVRKLDVPSLRFGRVGTEDSVRGCSLTPDINRDRRPDLACLASIQRTGFAIGDTKGILTGSTKGGITITGEDAVIIRR